MSTPSTVLALAIMTLTLSPGNVSAQFEPAEPINDHEYSEIVGSIYSKLAARFNADFSLPEKVYLTSASCGEPNAFYELEENQIVLCSELIDLMADIVLSSTDDELMQTIGLSAQILFTLYHELGHALIDVLDLAVLGREEDAADQLASVLMSEEPILALWAADFWRTVSGLGETEYPDIDTFAGAHGLNEQRYYNIMCWTYGADPLVRGYVVVLSELPFDRARGCEDEYDTMASAWERVLGLYLRNPATFSGLDPGRNASGSWSFVESMQDEAGEVRCTASGTMHLWQSGEELKGDVAQVGTCAFPGALMDNSEESGFEGGVVLGNQLGFDVDGCRYTGAFEGPDRVRLDGVKTCTFDNDDLVLTLSGRWTAVR
jgi:hypothetical protein